MRIASIGVALPRHYYDQATLTEYLQGMWRELGEDAPRLPEFHDKVGVAGRHLAVPLEEYDRIRTFGAANDAWIEHAVELGGRAVTEALRGAGLAPHDVDALFFSTVTGVASPSIDARLVNTLELRPDVKRIPMFGLGCVAGVAATARAADYVRAFPGHVAVVLMVEICSLTLQRDDCSAANLISSGLFGDGASAAVVTGADRAVGSGPSIHATRSVFYPDTEQTMGWHVSESGFRIVLSAAVPAVARERLGGDIDAFLADHDLSRRDVGSWVCHPGGPRVLRALEEALGLREEDLSVAWEHLRNEGNLSSVSVLMILGETLASHRPPPQTWGMMLAMGPGFCSELVLLRW